MIIDIRIYMVCAAYCPHFVQLILIRSIKQVVAEDSIENIFVGLCQIVGQVQVVDEAECGRFIFNALLDTVYGTVAQIESFV